jgi:hypothetical protein
VRWRESRIRDEKAKEVRFVNEAAGDLESPVRGPNLEARLVIAVTRCDVLRRRQAGEYS